MITKRNIEDKILLTLFGDDSDRFPGFFSIVNRLINDGSCVSTIQSKNIDFGGLVNFITISTYEAGVDLVEIKFDRETVLKWVEFKNMVECELQNVSHLLVMKKEELAELQEMSDTICAILEHE